MNKKTTSLGLLALPLVCFYTAQATAADQNLRGQGVSERTRTEYAPIGMKLGGFTLLPTLTSENEWKDNIYYNQNGVRDDFIFHVKPSLTVQSNWSKHSLLFNIDTDLQNYATHSTEDKDNYMLNIGGRFDVLRDSFLHANFTYGNQYENRGLAFFGANNNDQFSSLKPVNYDTIGGIIGYEHKMNRVRLNVDNETNHLGYVNGIAPDFLDSNGNLTKGGVIYNDNNRSRLKNETSIRIGYEINPNYEAFVKGSYNFIDYDSKFSSLTGSLATSALNGIQRSSDGFKIVTGVALDLTGKLIGNAYVGYQEQNYVDSTLPTISGATGGVGLKWLPTGLTTVKLNIDRAINETTQSSAAGASSGYFSTAFMASVDHELLRNLLLNVNGGYILNDYKGGNSRQEDVYVAGVGAKYLINRNFYLKGGYNYNTRTTNIFNTNYDVNAVYFTIGSQL